MTTLVLAEKPSVARDIAKVLGATSKADGYLHGNQLIVTWAIGHLVGLAEPHEIDPKFKKWNPNDLPILPDKFPLTILEKTASHFELLKRLLNQKDLKKVVCATDAGREGELIFRYIYEKSGCKTPVDRLWISSLTPEAIKKGWKGLKPACDYDSLADAAKARSIADWLVGMNLSRAYSLKHFDNFSVGRVQTPTLAMIVEREQAIQDFVPEDYLEIVLWLNKQASDSPTIKATFFDMMPAAQTKWDKVNFSKLNKRLKKSDERVPKIVEAAKNNSAKIVFVSRKDSKIPPPKLFDLTELQRNANRLFGLSAKDTLSIAQSLYEKEKLITYPRTDSCYLSSDMQSELKSIAEQVKPRYLDYIDEATGEKPLGKRYVDDSKVSDHHAIIPTTTKANTSRLTAEQAKIYDLICRRFLSAWQSDYVFSATNMVSQIELYYFHSKFHTTVHDGWKRLEVGFNKNKKTTIDVSDLTIGETFKVKKAFAEEKQTQPPPRLNDASLLTGMETAGQKLEDKELKDAMRGSGLGTPATRAATIENLIQKQLIRRQNKFLIPTEKGIKLIEMVSEPLKSPKLTGEWEQRLDKIYHKKDSFDAFCRDIKKLVADLLVVAMNGPSLQRSGASAFAANDSANPGRSLKPNPNAKPDDVLDELLKEVFQFEKFRPYQREVCLDVASGKDVLLVMPTGAGKSLCYQLPGAFRQGVTLVISPLIALMEDQVAKINNLGLRAGQIHSGKDRLHCRRQCQLYAAGELDFLFIAPERLGVPGFTEFLSNNKPSLIAVDEAHCISHWGHDFRPDYRMLAERLDKLKPCPIVALTATATPIVQADIVNQLQLEDAKEHIHGFRRNNLFIDVIDISPQARENIIFTHLANKENLPAIIYCSSRRKAEDLAKILAKKFRAAAYHAGLSADTRNHIQTRFINNDLDIIVATIAFGMGIDKANIRSVIHAALPSSIESYYQEIGRGGRDGRPANALLLQSYIDQKTHEFLFAQNYPEVAVLQKMMDRIPAEGLHRDSLEGNDSDEQALDKLWVHGGITFNGDWIIKTERKWKTTYKAQREQKQLQLKKMADFAKNTSKCRMYGLTQHFGDQNDTITSCGNCDVCRPDLSPGKVVRHLQSTEKQACQTFKTQLETNSGLSTGRGFSQIFERKNIPRSTYDAILQGLQKSGLLYIMDQSFEKDGRKIEYQKAMLTPKGRKASVEIFTEIEILEVTAAAFTRSGASAGGSTAKTTKTTKRSGSNAKSPQRKGLMNRDLAETLKAWRLQVAKDASIPAYRVLTNASIDELATYSPQSTKELENIRGIGPAKVKQYGKAIIDTICSHRRNEH